ncbi:MAG: PD-(D/E)XK nuclease family protein [Deltaproteobacteria bacterium]|nr:PD-(D/E)XK nuclease family protein [Deltaproteobacteria bacterium]
MAIESISRATLAVSVSQVKAYLLCPRRYELKYVRGEQPAFVPVPLAFGSAFHEALALFYGRQMTHPTPPCVEELIEVFATAWSKFEDGDLPLGGEEDDVVAEDHLDKGAAMLRAFHAHAAAQPPEKVIAVELPFSVSLHAPATGVVLEEKLNGVIDLVTESDSRKVIVEHKSAAKRWTLDQLRYDHQVTGYQLAARELGMGEVELRIQIVTKTKTPAVQVEHLRRDEQDEADFMATVVGVLKAIDAGVSYPVRGWQCRSCPYAHVCMSRAP